MLTDEQIVAHWNKHQDPLALGRFVEAAARRDALEAAAKVCDEQTRRSEMSMFKAKGIKAREIYSAAVQTSAWNAKVIRSLKEPPTPTP